MKKVTKNHRICHVIAALSAHGEKPTRHKVMEMVCVMEGKPFKKRNNNCYWQPKKDHFLCCGLKISYPLTKGRKNPSACYGVRFKELVKVIGKEGNSLVYALTAKGERCVKEFIELEHARNNGAR
jgi:hypothetical protein